MLDNQIQKTLFHWTSQLTTWFPRGGARLFDSLIPPLLGNRALVELVDRRNRAALRKVPKFERVLVIPDIHIGDAVMLQGAAMAFRDHFPGARVDYVIKKSVACLIEGNPAVSNLYPVFTGTVFPTAEDIQSVKRLVAENRYDLCFNCSPFFEDRALFPPGQSILNFLTVAPRLVRNELDGAGPNHFLHQSYRFPDRLLQRVVGTKPRTLFRGASVYLSDKAVEAARAFRAPKPFPEGVPVAFLNPDTASPYTFIPHGYQAELLKGLLAMGCGVLLGSGFKFQGIEQRLMESLTDGEREKVRIVPTTLPIDAYAALVDTANIFLSGDTGPLHIAAARKVSRSGNHAFRNRTFVISIFGATPPRMSGYDSTDPLFPPAHQDAPSRTYVSGSPCRNITCVNKMAKTCQKVRCYESLDTGRILADIQSHISSVSVG